ncbi:hypothetical protein L6R29_25470 [Myxococcota bacterium]|nr:hypothetical protein [Myxococcota bacterium]
MRQKRQRLQRPRRRRDHLPLISFPHARYIGSNTPPPLHTDLPRYSAFRITPICPDTPPSTSHRSAPILRPPLYTDLPRYSALHFTPICPDTPPFASHRSAPILRLSLHTDLPRYSLPHSEADKTSHVFILVLDSKRISTYNQRTCTKSVCGVIVKV